jgi:hypothetical protein
MSNPQVIQNRSRLVKAAVGLVVVALVVLTALLYQQNRDLKNASASSSASGKQESQRLTKKVGQLIELPSNDTATVATVRNAKRLQRQRFFRNAENGDKVLIFTKAKRVVVYREQDNRIVNVGPVVVGARTVSSNGSTSKGQATP